MSLTSRDNPDSGLILFGRPISHLPFARAFARSLAAGLSNACQVHDTVAFGSVERCTFLRA